MTKVANLSLSLSYRSIDGRSRRLVSAFGPFMKLNVGIIAPPLHPPPPQGIKNELAAGGGEEKAAQCRKDGGKRT